MSAYIPDALRQFVNQRAAEKCEYCLLHQAFSIYTHEIDHAIATKHGGKTTQDNLVLACLPCNRYKGSDLTSIGPITGKIVPLFNPRIHLWNEHFEQKDGFIIGLTAIGRTTVFLLQLNKSSRLQLRQALAKQSLYPGFA